MSNFGTAGLIKEPGAVYKVDQSGFATYNKTVSGVLVGAAPFMQGDVAEEWPNTVLMDMVITETGKTCNHVQIELHYEGTDASFTEANATKDISVDFTTSNEPIESHPDFVSLIGGSPSSPKHGAIFDQTTGEFVGFPVIDPDEPEVSPSRFAGIRSYLMPQETFSSNTVEYDYPTPEDIAKIGRVFDPGLNLPVLPGERVWLNTGIRVQNIANVYYRWQRTGMLSGPRKWVPEIYGTL